MGEKEKDREKREVGLPPKVQGAQKGAGGEARVASEEPDKCPVCKGRTMVRVGYLHSAQNGDLILEKACACSACSGTGKRYPRYNSVLHRPGNGADAGWSAHMWGEGHEPRIGGKRCL